MKVKTVRGQRDLHIYDPAITDGLVYWIDRVDSTELLVSVHAPGVEKNVLEQIAAHLRATADALDKIRSEL